MGREGNTGQGLERGVVKTPQGRVTDHVAVPTGHSLSSRQKLLLTLAGLAGAAYVALNLAGAVPPYRNRTADDQPSNAGQVVYFTPTVEPTATVMPTATAIPGIENVISEAEVKATLEELLANDRRLTSADTDTLAKVERVNKSLYFMLTGKTFEQQGFETRMVPRERYDAEVHPNLKGSLATVKVEGGKIYIYISLPIRSANLNFFLASETGQAIWTRDGPRNFDVGIINVDRELGRRMNETLDALYRAAVLNKLIELGVRSVSPPLIDPSAPPKPFQEQAYPGCPKSVNECLDVELGSDYFFSNAWAAAWALALDDPEARANLEATGWAGSENLMRIFNKYAMLDFRQHMREENIATNNKLEEQLRAALQNRRDYAPQIKAAVHKKMSPEGKALLGVVYTLP